ncbi:MAG: hypothetical protein WBJ75_07505 [Pseudohongiellaceae bacterium]
MKTRHAANAFLPKTSTNRVPLQSGIKKVSVLTPAAQGKLIVAD